MESATGGTRFRASENVQGRVGRRVPSPPETGTCKQMSLVMRMPFSRNVGQHASAHFRRRPSHDGHRRAGTARPTHPCTWEIARFSPDNSIHRRPRAVLPPPPFSFRSAFAIHKPSSPSIQIPGGPKFFPIIGKPPEIFSNHWKNRPDFSNHWKLFFQSLENFSGFFQPLEKTFPIIGKLRPPPPASRLRPAPPPPGSLTHPSRGTPPAACGS